MQQFTVPLSRLIPSKRNPRRVRPAREAHQRLVALIKAHGLIHSLVVGPAPDKPKYYVVIAGSRRLAALREVHKNDGDPQIPCLLRKVDAEQADALSLGENFGQEPMHPLDEADAFAKLARQDGKSAEAIGLEFGVPERYVRQRMKLAGLASLIKKAYRDHAIDTATAEAFAAVPEDRQLEVWKEVDGHPRHAEHVKNVIANDWIDAGLAIFDQSTLPASAVSQDLFAERVLMERKAFFEAQSKALAAESTALTEDGWLEVVVAKREEVHDRLLSMETVRPEFDAATTKKLKAIDSALSKIEKAARKTDDDARLQKMQSRMDALEKEREQIEASAPGKFSEGTKAKSTVFLILDPDGRVHREYRRHRRKPSTGSDSDSREGSEASSTPEIPTSDDLSDRQLAVTFTHQALCVREALHKNALARKRVLVLLLHEKIRSEAIAIRHDANGTTLHASIGDDFKSPAYDRLQAMRAKLDPFAKRQYVDDVVAYELLAKLSEKKLDALIDILIGEMITAHQQRPTALIMHFAQELKVNVRDDWKPDAEWLGSFQKIQLAHLLTELKENAPAPDLKKSELVQELSRLFADAGDGKLDDKAVAEKVNAWQPANLRTLQSKN